MSLNSLAAALIVIGVLLWLVNACISMDGKIKLKQDMNPLRKLLVLTIVFFSISNPSLVNSANYPLKVGPTQRYLVDQTGKPFLIQGDVPYAMVPSLTNPEVDTYLADRQSRGFNSIWIGLITPLWNGYENANPPPLDRYGHAPFTTPDDFSTPNPAYFTNADWIIQEANNYGINVFMHPCYAGYPGTAEGWYNDLLSNSTNKLYNYGVFVGNRYKNQPNIVWVMYGDHDPSSTLDPLEDIIAAGIRSVDTNHLFTLDYQRGTDVRAAHQPAWLTLNTAYTDHTTYTGVLRAYQENSPMPMFLFETDFEGEHASTPLSLREQEYWCNLSGACGQLFGNSPIWFFGTGWQAALSGTGSQDFTRMNSLFLSRPWYNLVPDASHTVVTAGYGSGGSYVTTARANDGATVISYIPTGAMVTMAMSNISGSQAQGWWYNPRDASSMNAGIYSTSGSQNFLTPTTEDWVLVLDDNSRQFWLPGSASPPPLVVTTSALANGTTAVAYSAQLTASGGTGAYSWSVVSSALPVWLMLTANGLLSGTPSIAGSFNFTVRATDGGSTTTDAALTLTVNAAANTSPTLTGIGNQTINVGGGTGPLGFTVGDAQTAAGSLVVSGSSSSLTLVPNGNIVFGGSGSNRTVTVTPAAGQSGTVTITVSVSDGQLSVGTNFVVTVNAVQTNGLVAAYSFNEGAGTTVADASGNGNTGTLNGATWTLGGKYGGALSFNGSSRVRVNDSSSLDLTNRMTLEAWVNPTVTGWTTVVMKEQAAELVYALYAGSSANRPNAWIYTTGEQGSTGPTALPPNSWSHLAATYDGTTLRLYVNGSQVASQAVSGNMVKSTAGLSMGGNGVWGDYFQGMIDEVRIYNRALSASEIQSDMNTPVGNAAANTSPTVTGIGNQTINVGGGTGPLGFTVGDAQTAAGSLVVNGSSSSLTLVPNGNIVFGGSGSNRTVTVTPAAGQSGTATITVSVSDGQLSASTSFVVVVTVQSNTTPTLTGIGNQTINVGGGTGPLGFTVGDAQTAAGSLVVNGSSSSQTLVPNGNIVFGGSGSNRTVTVTPAAGQSGTVTITVSVSDGQLSVGTNFVVTVNRVNVAPTVSISTPANNTSVAFGSAISFVGSAVDTEDGNRTSSLLWMSSLSGAIGTGGSFSRVLSGGTHTITATATDTAGATGSATVVVTVNPANTSPTLTGIGNQTINVGGGTGPLGFTVGDAQTAAGSLVVSGSSSSLTLVPNGNIVFGGSGSNRTVTVTPAAGQSGTVTITVSVSDGQLSVGTNFVVTVNAVQTNGLVAAYSFNEGAGTTVADASGNGNTGTLNGATWTLGGKYGGALSFNGSSRVRVNDSSSLDLTNRMTLEAWVNPTVTGWTTVVMKEQAAELVYALYAGSSANRPNAWIYTTGEQGSTGPTALPPNSWSHLAATYDGTTLRLYVNGSQVASQAVSGNMVKSTAGLSMGGNGVWGDYFQGMIDEVRIYNRALSASEIQSDMNTSVGH